MQSSILSLLFFLGEGEGEGVRSVNIQITPFVPIRRVKRHHLPLKKANSQFFVNDFNPHLLFLSFFLFFFNLFFKPCKLKLSKCTSLLLLRKYHFSQSFFDLFQVTGLQRLFAHLCKEKGRVTKELYKRIKLD